MAALAAETLASITRPQIPAIVLRFKDDPLRYPTQDHPASDRFRGQWAIWAMFGVGKAAVVGGSAEASVSRALRGHEHMFASRVRWLKSGSRVVDYRPGFEPWTLLQLEE